jgi:hypothetical protein
MEAPIRSDHARNRLRQLKNVPGTLSKRRSDEFRNVGLQEPSPLLRPYLAQQLDGSAAPSEGRRRLSRKQIGQKPVIPL